jgi:hypothetical protein
LKVALSPRCFNQPDRRCRADGDRIGDIARRFGGISLHGEIFTPPSNSNYFRHGTLRVVRARGAA